MDYLVKDNIKKGDKIQVVFPIDEGTQKNIEKDIIKMVSSRWIRLKGYQRLLINRKTLRNENTKEYNEKIYIKKG